MQKIIRSRKNSKIQKSKRRKILNANNRFLLTSQKRVNDKTSKEKNCNKHTMIDTTKKVSESIINMDKEKTLFDNMKTELLNESLNSSYDSVEESIKLFEWLIYPVQKDEFFEKNWEKNPLHIKRNKLKYYSNLMSTPMLDRILRNNYILYTKNLDITSFSNNKRETHNPHGRALPSIVWDYFSNGCSVRLLNPQTFIPKLYALNALLQEFFACFVGSNSYLTPPNSQGFAPHYDDIEAFVLQIEGKKRWSLYKPRTENEILPRYSSQNFSQKDLGEPILKTVVQAGDILYFPRGIIHQGDTFGFDQPSLHITLSVYQRNSWGDFLEKLIPATLNNAINNDIRFRKGLPMNYLRHIGCSYINNSNCQIRQKFTKQINSLLTILISQYVNIDKAADEMAVNHIHDFLPPILDTRSKFCSIYDGAEKLVKHGIVINRVKIVATTKIKLTTTLNARLVKEGDYHRLYYSNDNSKEYHEYELQFLEVDFEFVSSIKVLFNRYPQYIKVEDLPMNDLTKKLQLAHDLWDKGIVISQKPLEHSDE